MWKWNSAIMSRNLPLDCLRFFESAARHQSFKGAAAELEVTAAAVAYRVRMFEVHLGEPLFERMRRRGVQLTPRGNACFGEVRRILADIDELVERYGSDSAPRRLRIVAVEPIAEQWLLPRLARFAASHADIAVEVETDHAGVGPNRDGYDAWITCTGDSRAPGPESARHETLFQETLIPVCSPALLKARGRPRAPEELHRWPLIYHLGWPGDWALWYAAQGHPPPDLSRASGFRLCSLLVQAAVQGMGVAIGRPSMLAGEMKRGELVPVCRDQADALAGYSLITTAAARRRPEVEAFREWLLHETSG